MKRIPSLCSACKFWFVNKLFHSGPVSHDSLLCPHCRHQTVFPVSDFVRSSDIPFQLQKLSIA